MSIIIGFGHKKRNGKDTAVDAIIAARGGLFVIKKYSFANALKQEYVDMCRDAGDAYAMIQIAKIRYNTPDWVEYELGSDLTDPICGEFGKQRKFLQWLASYRREQDSLYWIKKVAKAIGEDQPQFAIISDMRYKNEAAWIKLVGGFTTKVTRVGCVNNDNHISEHDLDDYEFDFEIGANDGDVAGLRSAALEFFDYLYDHLSIKPGAFYGNGKDSCVAIPTLSVLSSQPNGFTN